MSNLVLNRNIFTLYQDDANLTNSQNLRLRNITIALGLWGSMAASMQEPPPPTWYFPKTVGLSSFESFWWHSPSTVRAIFTAVPALATAVAYIAVPVVQRSSPLVSRGAALAINDAAEADVAVVSFPALTFDAAAAALERNKEQHTQPRPPAATRPAVSVTLTRINDEDRQLRNGEEFHPALGEDIVLRFSVPNADFTQLTSVDQIMLPPYEPDLSLVVINSYAFRFILDREGCSPNEFKIKIRARVVAGFLGADARISYGFRLFDTGAIAVNESKEAAVSYKKPSDVSEMPYQDLVVVRFCISPSCPDYCP